MSNCAVYAIRQLSTGRRYVGGSTGLKKRWAAHLRTLRNGTHHCTLLQAAYSEGVENDFVFEIIERCKPAEVRSKEQEQLDKLRPDDFNIAISAVAGDMLSRHPRRAAIIAQRAQTQQATLDKMTEEERKKRWSRPGMLNGMYGRTHTPEVCAASGARMRGKPSTFKGKHHTPEARALLSASATRRTGARNAFFGRHHSAETKAKIAAANTGSLPPNVRAVLADGVQYISLNAAARALGVTVGTIFFRIRSPNFDYHYCQLNA
jgi:group I intron endonuclease